ncbi:zinc finger protein 729-like isoform X2 [Ostrea edulis]|uniref:zinc finger protein 729-like isoform X2 n=1 Tax=Ostrea edulis TaxID=37623 RepID=UPI0024AF09FF|nr:zinc finger protein 729-like isoform X2 [Ostrea edulis]
MAENLPKDVLPQTSPKGEENVVVVLLPSDSEAVESVPLESQLNPENLSSDIVTSEQLPTEGDSLENPTGVATSGISLDTPLLQWTPQQTMYTSAEAIQQDIQILLGKLREYGQESLLITANKESIQMDGSSEGKEFLKDNEGVARSFHQQCFGSDGKLLNTDEGLSDGSELPLKEAEDGETSTTEVNTINRRPTASEGPVLMKIVHESTGINVEESGNLPAPRKRGRPPKYKTAVQNTDQKKTVKETEDKEEKFQKAPVTVRKRGRPPKNRSTEAIPTESMASKESEKEVQEAENDTPHNLPYTGKKRGRKPKETVMLFNVTVIHIEEDTDSSSGGIRRSSRPAKRKVIESIGYTPPKVKIRKSGIGMEDLKIKKIDILPKKDISKALSTKTAEMQIVDDRDNDVGMMSDDSAGDPDMEDECNKDAQKANKLVCSNCGFSAESQEVMENHIRVEHPKMWAQILLDDTKILLALGKNSLNVQKSKLTAHPLKKEPPKEQNAQTATKATTTETIEKKKKIPVEHRSSGHYSCSICHKKYKVISLLNAHMGLIHKDRRFGQMRRKKELLKYKQRLIAMRNKKKGQTVEEKSDVGDTVKEEDQQENITDPEGKDVKTDAKVKMEEVKVEETRRFRRSSRRKSKKLDDYETDLPDLYRSDEEELDTKTNYDEPHACPLCLKNCYSESGLNEHLKRSKHDKVTVTPFPCLTCNRFFLTMKALELHMTQSGHIGEEMGSLDGEIKVNRQTSVSKRGMLLFVCSLCKREFVRKENCESHCAMKVCKKPWKKSCPIISCKKLFFENNMFFHHMTSEHKEEFPFVCPVEGCKRLFFHTAALNSHVSAHSSEKDGHVPPPRPIEDGRKRCGYCGMLFAYNENLRQHVKIIHDNDLFGQYKDIVEHNQATEPISSSKKFLKVESQGEDKAEEINDLDKIDTFKKMDKRQVTIRNHVKGNEFKCYTCNEVFSHIDDVGDHMVDSGHCGLPLDALNGERNIKIRIRNTGEQCYVCTLCKMEFKKKDGCEKHIEASTCKKKYKRLCPIMKCRILFRNFNYFKAHMTTMHEDEFPFKCEECGKEFEQTSALNSHRNSHYKDTHHIQADVLNSDTPLTCHICKERFRNNIELRAHKESVHEIQRKFMCDICGKKYKRKENLKDHIYMVHERDPEKDFVTCPTCGKALASQRSLRFHMRFAHTDAKPCVCEICGYSTKQLGNLAFHMRNTHSETRPYECEWPDCGKTFKDRQLWQRHVQRHELTVGNLEKARTYGPVFTCKICQKGFCGKYNLEKHMLCHTSECPLSCTLCGKGMKRMSSLRRHMRNVHHFDPKTNTSMVTRTIVRKPKPLMKKEAVQINLGLATATQEEQESIEADFKELSQMEYQFTTEAQQKLQQILTPSIGDIPVTTIVAGELPEKTRDYLSEAQSQVSLLESTTNPAESVIEEAVDESQIIIENAGDQYIIMNPDGNISNLEQLGRDIILAVKNEDGTVCFQMVGK